mmetsp:Transcript_27329/g.54683  ORF Transcript_27329/g.54683 Transcript_27329/m.54683 type:complete len:437 (+) Transcript_27329:40-1350(+)
MSSGKFPPSRSGRSHPRSRIAFLHHAAAAIVGVLVLRSPSHGAPLRPPGTTAAFAAPATFRRTTPASRRPAVPLGSAAEVAAAVLPSVALVEPVGVRNITSRGAGFAVDFPPAAAGALPEHIYLLTAAHVATPGAELYVSFPPADGGPTPARLPAEVVGREGSSDLALVRVVIPPGGAPPRPLVLGGAAAPVGTDAFAFGFPPGMLGNAAAMSAGIVCGMAEWPVQTAPGRRFRRRGRRRSEAVAGADANADASAPDAGSAEEPPPEESVRDGPPATFVMTDAALSPGMSGGPLTDRAGTVLGLCALVRPDAGGLGNYAVSADTCRRFVAGLAGRGTHGDAAGAPAVGYRVVLFNDRMNTRKQVDYVLRDRAALGSDDAKAVMMSAHRTGRGVVRNFYAGDGDSSLEAVRGQAEDLCAALRGGDVSVEVEEIFDQA